jgi:uncharacterized membrane protein
MNQALKGVAGRGEGWAELSVHLIFLSIFTVFALVLGMLSYRRMLSEEKRA